MNRLESPLYNFENDHDTASKIAHKIFIISNVLIQLTQCDVLMTLLNEKQNPVVTNFIP